MTIDDRLHIIGEFIRRSDEEFAVTAPLPSEPSTGFTR